MKKILILIGILFSINSFSQSTVLLRGDTIRVYKQGGDAVLKLDSTLMIDKFKQGNSNDSVLTWDPVSKKVRMMNRNSFGGGGGGTDLSAIDTLINPRWDVVQNTSGSSYKASRKPVFNVKDFGAVADNSTDAQPYIQRAIDSAFFHRDEFGRKTGGIVYIPSGMYALTAIGGNGGHLNIPLSSFYAPDTAVTIEIIGENAPMPWTNPITDAGSARPPLTGTVLRSTLLADTSIIVMVPGSSPYGSQNFTHLVVKDLGLRVRSMTGVTHVAPKGTGIKASEAASIEVDNVRIDTESPRDSTVQPATTAIGISFPTVSNWVQISLMNSIVTGYYKAITVGEHFKTWNSELDGNYYGLVTYSGTNSHLININSLGLWRNKYQMQINGTCYLNGVVRLESNTGSNWNATTADLDEPSTGTALGSIGFHRVADGSVNGNFSRTNSAGSLITTYNAGIGETYTTGGYGQGRMENLRAGVAARYDFLAAGNGAAMTIGVNSSTSTPSGAIDVNDAFFYNPNADIVLMTPNVSGGKIKIATAGTAQTHAIDIEGYKYGIGGSVGAYLGSFSSFTYPCLYMGPAATSPDFTNFTLFRVNASEANYFNGYGSSDPRLVFSILGDNTNTMIFNQNKRLGIGFAYNGTPTASLHIRAGSSGASGAPLKFTTSGAALLATPEAGAMEVLVDSLYWTGNSGTRYKVYPQSGSSAPTLQQTTNAGNITTREMQAHSMSVKPITGGYYINIDSSGNMIQTGYGAYIGVNNSNRTFIVSSIYSAAGTQAFYGGNNIELDSTGGVIFPNYGNSFFTGVPSNDLMITSSGYLIDQSPSVNLTESSATTFYSTTVSSMSGGEIVVTVKAGDATDFQARTLRFIWSAVNKAGTLTITISTPEETAAISNGSTLTCTITAVDGGSGVVQFKANAVSSLTQSVLACKYRVKQNF